MLCIRVLFSAFLLVHSTDGLTQTLDTVKCWSGTDKLKWNDFKGSVPKELVKSNRMAACHSQMIVHSVRNKSSIQFTIKVIFLKNISWTKDTVSLATLAHEQLHFDLTELHARKIRKSISELKIKGTTDFSVYQSSIAKFMSENEKMQVEYDKQTNHGGDEIHQKEWIEKIRKELDSLKSFSTVDKDCL